MADPRERAQKLANSIEAALHEPDGTGTRIDIEDGDWELITAALTRFAVSETSTPKGWAIRHADETRWRTMDTIGMPDWTLDPAKALVCRLREHVDAYAADDPDDVRIVEVDW